MPLPGRDREADDLLRATRGTRLLTLCGPGGIGKTRLLRRLLTRLADEYDEVFLVRLGGLGQPGLLPGRVAAALGVGAEPGVPLPDTLAGALRGRRLVLALDGCDQAAEVCAELCQRLLSGTTGLLVVAASREPLGVAGELAAVVAPLGLPAARAAGPVAAARSDAVRLFAARAAAADPGFALGPENVAAVGRICRAAGGVPLAIEIAAAGARDPGLESVAASLEARLRAAGAPAVPAPAAALGAAIGWAYDLLNPAEQVLLGRLSVFAGWSEETAQRVCADKRLPAGQVAGLQAGLARRGLIEPEPGQPGPGWPGRPGAEGQVRYRMAGAVRDFAAGCLARAGESEMARRRLRDYAARLAEYMRSLGTARVPASWPVLQQVFRSYKAEAGNFRAVLAWCLEHSDTEAGLRVCTAIQLCWLLRGRQAEGEYWLDAFLAADLTAVPAAVRGPALVCRAQLAYCEVDLARTRDWATTGLELCRGARDPYFSAAALDLLAKVELFSGRPEEALRLAEEAVATTQLADDRWHRGFVLGTRCFALATLGRLTEASQWAQAGLALMQEIDNRWGAAQFRVGLGNLARMVGDPAAACDYYRAALPFMRAEMTATELAACLASLGRAALAMGDLGPAREALTESLRLNLTAGRRAGIARCLLAFASLAAREGRPDRAVVLAAAVTALCEESGLRPPPKRRIRRYLDAAAGLGETETARLWAAGQRLSCRAAAGLALERPALNRAEARAAQS